MKLIYCFIFFISLIINYSYSVDLVDDKCFSDILSKIQSPDYPSGFDKSTICGASIVSPLLCDSNGYVIQLSLSDDAQVKQTLTWSDFSCFSKITSLSLYQMNLESEFLYLISLNFTKLSLKSTNIQQINKIIPTKVNTLVIDTLSSVVKSSYLKNIRSIEFQNQNPGFEFEADSVGQSDLNMINIYSTKLPDLTNLQAIFGCNFKFIIPFDQTTASNLGTFAQKCQSITLSALSALDFEIPQSFQTVVNPIYTSVMIGNNMNLRTNSLLDLSNNVNSPQRTTFSWSNAYSGSNFNVDGKFPFAKFPKGFQSFYFDMLMSYFDNLPDLSMFKEYFGTNPRIGIRNCATKNGTLQSNNGIFSGISKVLLSNNNLQGPLDSTWCNGVELDVSGNYLSGELPMCYYCYLNDSTVYNRFEGNGFTNFDLSNISSLCNYKTIIPNVKLLSASGQRSFKIYGDNLGYNIANIKSSNAVVLSYDTYGNQLTGSASSQVDKFNMTIVSLGLTYTLSVSYTRPIINQIIQKNDTFSFIGEYFTYNLTDTTILIDNYQYCTIKNTTFYQIDCVVDKQLRDRGLRPTTFTVKDLDTTTSLAYEYLTLECSEPCNNGYCNTINGTCACYSGWLTIEGYGNCLVPDHYVSSVIQVPIKTGGDLRLNGWFGNLHDDLSVKIGNTNLNIKSNDETSITVSVGPGSGVQTIQIYQNKHTWIGRFYIYYDPTVLCPNNCTSKGICNDGECKCLDEYSGIDCSIKIRNTTTPNNPILTIDDGTISFKDSDIKFFISIVAVYEIDLNGNIIDTWILNQTWKSIDNSDQDSSNLNPLVSTFYQNRGIDNSTITLIVEHIENAKRFNFAGLNFSVDAGGVKFTLELKNFNFKSNLNTLQLEISTTSDIVINPCIDHHVSVQSSSSNTQIENNVNYLKIIKDNKEFYGRFLSRMLSDGYPVDIKTSIKQNTTEQVSIIIDLPKCDECILDPDFSVLINPNYQNKDNKCGNNKRAWVLPVAIVVPVVVVSILIAAVVYKKKKSISLKVRLRNVSLKSFTDRSRK